MRRLTRALTMMVCLLAATLAGCTPATAQTATPVRQFRSLRELLALDPRGISDAGHAVVEVLAWATNRAGGGGLLRYSRTDASATNRCGPYAPDTGVGRWSRVNWDGDVRGCGAVGDDVTDDTEAVQAAFDAVDTVLFSAGTNLVTRPVVAARHGQRIFGPGALREASILTNVLRVTGHRVSITELKVLGVETAGTFDPDLGFYRVGIYSLNASNVVVESCEVRGKSCGIYFDGGGPFRATANRLYGFWTWQSSATGINNGAGLTYRDAEGSITVNWIEGFGQGICGPNRLGAHLAVTIAQNWILNCGDNGMYLLASRGTAILGNIINDTRGAAIKVHGVAAVSGNTSTNTGIGISMFGIHVVPLPGTLEHRLSTNRWGPNTRDWYTSVGAKANGNIIRRARRHGIDFGYTTIGTNRFWNYGLELDRNHISLFGETENDAALRGSGSSINLTGNNVLDSAGTNNQFGLLFGGQVEDLLGFEDLRVAGNSFELKESYDVAMQIGDVGGLTVSENIVKLPNAVSGLVLLGINDAPSENSLWKNKLGASQIRFLLRPSTNVVALFNVRSAVVKGVEPVGFFEIAANTAQLTVDAIRTFAASTSETYPFNFTLSSDVPRSGIFWNRSTNSNALASWQVAVGYDTTVSGGMMAVPHAAASQFAGLFGLIANSDADGLFLSASKPSDIIYMTTGGTPLIVADTNKTTLYRGLATRAPTNTVTGLLGVRADASAAPMDVVVAPLADLVVQLQETSGHSTNGLMVRTGPGVGRTVNLVGDAEAVVTHGDGQDGNPTVAIGAGIARYAALTAMYQPLDADLTVLAAFLGTSNLVTLSDFTGHYHAADRARANHTGTQDWSTITGEPTTLGGYGITDGQPLDADLTVLAGFLGTSNLVTLGDFTGHYHAADRARANHTGTQDWATITGEPTTLGGYGITDGQPLSPHLTELAGITDLAGTMPYFTGSGLSPLGIGSPGQFLMVTNAPNRPVWVDLPAVAAVVATNLPNLTVTNAAAFLGNVNIAGDLDVDEIDVTGTVSVADSAYGPSWDSDLAVPTRNAIFDKIESLSLGSGGGAWTGTDDNGHTATNLSSVAFGNTTTISPSITQSTTSSATWTASVRPNSLTTNEIAPAFREWIVSMMGSGGGTNGTYVSTTNAIPAAENVVSFSHGLGALPKDFDAWLFCTDADTDYVVGDLLPVTSTFYPANPDGVPAHVWSISADATNIVVARGANSGSLKVHAKDDGRTAAIDETKWVLFVTATKDLAGSGGSGGGTATLARFIAQDGEPPASSYATFSTRNSLGVLLFDPATQEAMRLRWVYPEGYAATSVTVVVKWVTSATSGDARWGVRNMALTGDIDSDSFGSAVEATTSTSATAGTVMTTTLSGVSLDGAVAGDQVWTEVYRDVGDSADSINANDLEFLSAEVRAE